MINNEMGSIRSLHLYRHSYDWHQVGEGMFFFYGRMSWKNTKTGEILKELCDSHIAERGVDGIAAWKRS